MPQQQSARHRVTLCFDIDDCLECFVPSSELMPESYKQAMLNRIPPLVFEDMLDGKVQNTEITLRLFTNRKDHSLDIHNINQHKTAGAKDILNEMQDKIKSWLNPQCSQLIIDSRFHVDQVFASKGGFRLNYDRSLYEISDLLKKHGVDEVCNSNTAIANKNKIDMITTILHEVSMLDANRQGDKRLHDESSPHIVVFFDDRFSDDHEENINSVIEFLANTPEAIPKGLLLKFIQLDPYLDRRRLENFVGKIRNQSNYSKPDYLTQDEHDRFKKAINHVSMFTRNVLNGIPHLMDYFLYNHNYMTDQSSFESAIDQFQEALRMKMMLSGSGTPGRHFAFENCWQEFLIPMAKAYKTFLESPMRYSDERSPMPGFYCALSEQSIFRRLHEADASRSFQQSSLTSEAATDDGNPPDKCPAKTA